MSMSMATNQINDVLNYWIDLSHCCCTVPNATGGCLHCDLKGILSAVGCVVANDDDDFNEPLGQACQLGDTECESCQ